MTPNEQKAYEAELKNKWDKFCEEKEIFVNEDYSDHMPYFLQQSTAFEFITSVLAQARADERRRIVEAVAKLKDKPVYEINGLIIDNRQVLEGTVIGHNNALSDVLSLINKE